MFDEDVLILFIIFGVPAALIALIVWLKGRERERNARYMMQSNLYSKALEKGEPLPALPENFFDTPPAKAPKST